MMPTIVSLLMIHTLIAALACWFAYRCGKHRGWMNCNDAHFAAQRYIAQLPKPMAAEIAKAESRIAARAVEAGQ